VRLGVFGWAAIAVAIILFLAGLALRRPLGEWLEGARGAGTSRSPGTSDEASPARVRFEAIASGFAEPVDLQFVPGLPGEAVLLEKAGRARLVTLPQPQGVEMSGVDVVTLAVHKHSELGLLGLAFHPRYADNGLFYLNDNPHDGGPLRTRISEWELPRAELGKRPARHVRTLLEIDQPYPNHDGGQVAFGPDNYLYIGMGDGGSRADPQNYSQNLGSWLGKMLRIDVDARPGYAVPSDNPFVGTPGARPEIWAYGLRNPWRFSFDPKQRLIAADVGQDLYEEIDWVSAGDNMGWKVREAAHCFFPRDGCETKGLVDPIFEYERAAGMSVTGGYVYLGQQLPWLRDKYVFADFVSGRVWALQLPEQKNRLGRAEDLGRFPHAISAFGRDAGGELYALDFRRGLVLRLAPL
jgi:glucose/arabinose dehydrogenase